MVQIKKGQVGYINYQRKLALVRTIIIAAIVLGLYIAGRILTGTNKNLFSVLAILLCLPLGWSAINTYMFMRAKKLSTDAAEKIKKHAGQLFVQYELYMTSEKESYNVSAITVLEKNIIAYSEDEDIDCKDAEDHIKHQIALSKYHDYTIKMFTDINAFCKRLDELERLRASHGQNPIEDEKNWVPGTLQTVAGILNSISL